MVLTLKGLCLLSEAKVRLIFAYQGTVTARKDDAPAAHQAALAKVPDRGTFSSGGGLIHTTSG
jgi:hypothetical protein